MHRNLTIDITWASLAAIAVVPDEYGAGKTEEVRLRYEQLMPELLVEVDKFRKRPAGRFVLDLYKKERC